MKIKYLKKVLPLLLSFSMVIGNFSPAFAYIRAYLDNNSSEENVEYYDESSLYNQEELYREETKLTLTTPEYFSVIIPKKIIINGTKNESGEFEKTYEITVKGDISGDKFIKVESPEVILTNGNKTSLRVNTNSENEINKFLQNDSEFVSGFINVTTPEMATGKTKEYIARVINKEDVKAGKYTGITKFDIGLFYRSGALVDEEETTILTYETTDNETSNLAMGMLNLLGIHTVHADPVRKEIDENKIKGTALVSGLKDSSASNIIIADYYEDEEGYLYEIIGIKSAAFEDCQSIESVTFSESVKRIEYGAFYHCLNLKNLYFSEGLTHIGARSFMYCSSLGDVTFPSTIEDIEGWSFLGTRSMFNVFYKGTYEQWNNINKTDGDWNADSALESITFKDKYYIVLTDELLDLDSYDYYKNAKFTLWNWDGEGIIDGYDELLTYCIENNITDIYQSFHRLDIYTQEASNFIRDFENAGIRVFRIIGDTSYAYNYDACASVIDEQTEFNKHSAYKLTRIIFDNEVYTMPDYDERKEFYDTTYIETSRRLYDYCKEQGYTLFVTAGATQLQDHPSYEVIYRDYCDGITVMNYFKDSIKPCIAPMLKLARQNGKEIVSIGEFNPEGSYFQYATISEGKEGFKSLAKLFRYNKLAFSYHWYGEVKNMDN